MLSLPKDKQDHFVYSIALVVGLSIFTPLLLPLWGFSYPITGLELAVGIAFLIGAGKELIHDWYMVKGNPEALDMVANVFGYVTAYMALYLA